MKSLVLSFFLMFGCLVSMGATESMGEIARLREAADSLHSIGRTDSAAMVGERAIRLAEESGDPTQIVGTHAAQGVFLRSLGKIDEALENYDSALAIVTSGKFRENPDQKAIEEIASLYINLAVLQLDTQHKDLAAKNAVLSCEWISQSEDPELRSAIYGVAGSVLTGCGDLDKAKHYQDLAYRDALESGDKETAFRSAAYTMLTASRLGDKKEEQAWREKCEAMMPEIESGMAKLVYYQAECSICLAGGDRKGSLTWFNRILSIDGIDNLPFVKFDCYNNMHTAYAGLGDYENAYLTLMKSTELRDSLWEVEKTESLRDLTVKYETKETELALAQSEAKRATTLMWLFAVAGLLLIAVILFVAYANKQRQRRMKNEIEFAKLRTDIGKQLTQQYIEGLETERLRMSRELHDGVCNDLLAIEMNLNGGKTAENVAGSIAACRETVRRISHELMPPEFAYADLDEVVRYFVGKQSEANIGKTAITYESSASGAEWSQVSDADALEVYRIVQEAVGNAVKYSGATEIKVFLSLEGKTLTATISDNGTFRQASGKGLGIESMRRRAAAIGGKISIETTEDSGTKVKLER